ncbi:MAG: bifunctional aldolase/short-chain dehydrogenase [Chloroflexi bacterium]|nr:bifunctional aldolase/short-chain dehydrogenase [Chloroflexota bacterium]
MPKNLWNETEAAGCDALDLLVYRSHLLGADRAVCNIYGGNTGSKVIERDFRGSPVRTLWVKGSGSDLATMQRKDFAGLRMDDIELLFGRDAMPDEEMTAYLSQCLIGLQMPRQSIETLLHGFIPAAHTDHTHPDAVISLACSPNGKHWMREIYGDRAAWVDYIRPGFTLSKQIATAVRSNPNLECVVMGKHGLVTWGDEPKATYDHTIAIIQTAEDFVAQRAQGKRVFGVITAPEWNAADRREIAEQIMPVLRGAAGAPRSILHLDDAPDVLNFVNAEHAKRLAAVGAACPDHLVHTKRTPLFVEWGADPSAPLGPSLQSLVSNLREEMSEYVAAYKTYFEENKSDGDKLFNPVPRVVLIPGVGMITTGKDAQLARVSADLYHRAINVIGGATALDEFDSLTPAEAYAIEYWPLELYKLAQRPPDRELTGRIALITGAASGIGRATAYRLAQEGAHVVIADLNLEGAQAVAQDIVKRFGHLRGLAVPCNVTREEAVVNAFRTTVATYGGVDIVVSNAGIASSSAIQDTTLPEWDKLYDILVKGYFLVAREAFKLWQRQNLGGSLIFVASKNGLVASKNAAAYNSAKAAEIHLARSLAEEGGALGVRVNVVNPDAVLQGSSIWDAGWREARAKGMGIAPDQLEEAYRQRTTLKVNVYPEDIAEAILFFASDRSAKTTGAILNVDGGLVAAYVR